MLKEKLWRICIIGILVISILSGCNKAKDTANNVPDVDVEEAMKFLNVTTDGEEKTEEITSLEDLYFDRYKYYEGFVSPKDPNAILSIGEEEKVFKVGQDIQPGNYIAVRNGEYASVTINEDGNLGDGDILFIDLCDVNCIFELKDGQYLVAKGCNVYENNSEYKAPMDGDAYLPGMFQAGLHIPIGEYVAIGAYPAVTVYRQDALNS